MTVGQKIRIRRKELGMTQKQLGELCGMADSAIRKYESGRITPKHQTLKKIAGALRIPEWELTGVEFEFHDDGSSAAIVDVDRINREIARKLTASSDPKGIKLGILLENEADRKTLISVLEKGVVPPDFTDRLLTAFNKLNFLQQMAIVREVEGMVADAPIQEWILSAAEEE